MATDKIIALGRTAKEWIDLLHGDAQKKAKKALNYLDGRQEEEIINVLNDPNSGRRNWKQKGFIPRFRNLTSMIVEKSGMLFNDSLPVFELYKDGKNTEDQKQTEMLYKALNNIAFQETLINDDQLRRLLKTSIWLFQVDDNNNLLIDLLHRANCGIVVDNAKQIIGLIYSTDEKSYRIITADEYIDLILNENKQPAITSQEPNPFGIVPASMFYDTKLPRQGVWGDYDNGLVSFNESYNIHLTDSEFTMKWAKLPTLMMIDCSVDDVGADHYEQVMNYGDVLPQTVPTGPEITGGPGSVVSLLSNGNKTPSVTYVGPTVDIKPIEDVYNGWCKSIAQDWSVQIKSAGDGTATSGFQLVVEEIPNLELRKQRQRVFENGMKRAWPIIRKVLNTVDYNFTDDTTLFVEFTDPKLPVDAKSQEEVWSMRIDSGRATIIDYFQQEYGLTEQEAEEKWIEIAKFKLKSDELNKMLTNENQTSVEDTGPKTVDDADKYNYN